MPAPTPLRDERVSLALRQLALARGIGDQVPIDRAESLVVSVLLPFAVERTEVGSDPAAVADILRITAARLTRAVMEWEPAAPPEVAAISLLRKAVPGPVGALPDSSSLDRPSAAPDPRARRLPRPAGQSVRA